MTDGMDWFGEDFVPEKEDGGQDTRLGSGSFNFAIPYVGFVTIKAIIEMKKKPNFSKITRQWHSMDFLTFSDKKCSFANSYPKKHILLWGN